MDEPKKRFIRTHDYNGWMRGCDCDICYRAFKRVRDARREQTTPNHQKRNPTPTGPKSPASRVSGNKRKQIRTKKPLEQIKCHGATAYRAGCRCTFCMEWWRKLRSRQRISHGIATREEYDRNRKENPKHGITRYRKEKCRCEVCVKAHQLWWEENRDRLLINEQRYRAANREKRREYTREWEAKNHDKLRADQRKRYAARKARRVEDNVGS